MGLLVAKVQTFVWGVISARLKQGESRIEGPERKTPKPEVDRSTKRCTDSFKQWTGKSNATIIYDSTVDEFTVRGLINKVGMKENIALVGFTTGGDVFGGFYSVGVERLDESFYDPNIFAFSFFSHWRCETPRKFPVYRDVATMPRVLFFRDYDYGFVLFGVCGRGAFYLGNERSKSYCEAIGDVFKGLRNTTFTGMNGTRNGFHHNTRLIAVQLS